MGQPLLVVIAQKGLFSPDARYFDFRFVTKFRRITTFFDRMDRQVVVDSIRGYRREMDRVAALVQEHFGAGLVAPKAARQLFDEVTRARESVIRFSEPRALREVEPRLPCRLWIAPG